MSHQKSFTFYGRVYCQHLDYALLFIVFPFADFTIPDILVFEITKWLFVTLYNST